MLVLWDHEEGVAEGVAGGFPLAEFKRYISTDRSNARRAIRGLIDRGLVAETTDEEGVRRVALTGGGHLACWLASYPDDWLALGAVPSRPLNLELDDENPLGSREPSWSNAAASESPLSDNGPSDPDREDPMQGGKPHANPGRSPDRPVSDNDERIGSTMLEMVAKMARRRLEELDEGEGP